MRWAGVFLDCCGGGMIWAGRWSGAGDFIFFLGLLLGGCLNLGLWFFSNVSYPPLLLASLRYHFFV